MIDRNSDTVAMTMIYICYRLAKDPEQLEKLQKELDTLDSLEDLKVLQALPHLNGVINETLRLHPAVPTGGLRQAPASGPYYCIGKNLALSELRFVTALLASKYNITFPAGENGDSCVEDMVDQFTAAPGQLDLVFSKRKNDCF
ncbi:MAG: hypothetical protein LQ343_006076 [Gyalolechia ehrenbergii]|nr:MAG: hypothetical protein LQ343_006076 [Gyalolechia ehrenbergii]